MRIIADVNNKGGVAKTTTAANVGACCSYLGYKTLLIDSDPQSNLTQHFNFYNVERSIADAYEEAADKSKNVSLPILSHSDNDSLNENLFLVPSSPKLNSITKSLSKNFREPSRVLSRLLTPYKDEFDICIIDLPPSLGELTTNAIYACDQVLIPVEAGQFSINGVTEIMAYLKELKDESNLNFGLLGLFMSKFDVRNNISFAAKSQLEKDFGEEMFDTYIRINTEIGKAQTHGEDIYRFSRNSNSALDYENLTKEILIRLELVEVEA